MLEGRTCTADNEIVITEFIAANFGITIGDTVTVRGDSGSDEYIVSGIYSCANDMGDNFGMNREGYLKIGTFGAGITSLQTIRKRALSLRLWNPHTAVIFMSMKIPGRGFSALSRLCRLSLC